MPVANGKRYSTHQAEQRVHTGSSHLEPTLLLTLRIRAVTAWPLEVPLNVRLHPILRTLGLAGSMAAVAMTGAPAALAETTTTTSTSVVAVIVIGTSTTTSTTSTRPTVPTTATVKPRVAAITCENAPNHGAYVAAQPKGKRAEAAKSDCGKKHASTTTTVASGIAPVSTSSTSTSTSSSVPSSARTTSTIDEHPGNSGHDSDQRTGKSNGNSGKGINGNGKGRGNGKN